VEVSWFDRDAARHDWTAFEGWPARILQHEIDHLDGILFTDHLRGLRRERIRRQLRKLAAELEEVHA